jgi:hypothetical protein
VTGAAGNGLPRTNAGRGVESWATHGPPIVSAPHPGSEQTHNIGDVADAIPKPYPLRGTPQTSLLASPPYGLEKRATGFEPATFSLEG